MFRVISDPQERLNLLKAGTLQVAFDVPAKDAAAIREQGDRETKLVSIHSPWSFGLAFNNSQEPFKDKRVRQALSYAVPYDQIIKNVMHGLARPAKSMVPPGMDTHDQSAWKYDTIWQRPSSCSGRRPSGRVQEPHRRADRPPRGRAGRDPDPGQLPRDRRARPRSEARRGGVPGEAQQRSSPMQIVEFYSWVTDPFLPHVLQPLSENTFTNSARYANQKVDSLIAAGLYEPDLDKRGVDEPRGPESWSSTTRRGPGCSRATTSCRWRRTCRTSRSGPTRTRASTGATCPER